MTLWCISWFNTSQAKELTLATSKSIPPYIFEETENGIQIERVRAAFDLAGHSIKKIIFTSNKRAELLLKQKKVDAIINVAMDQKNLYYSDPVIHYQNSAISLSRLELNLKSIEELAYYRVMAFQNAKKFLGNRYATAVSKSPIYDEAVNQLAQLERLYNEQVDVIILDVRIFEYFNQLYNAAGKYPAPVQYHYIFPSSPRSLGFHNATLRNDFNRGLKKLLSPSNDTKDSQDTPNPVPN
ncbi:substrate-binding periplasmic protein [Litoribrevibacter euphylliae]|uniref:Substrate-binding periplasmic protein n=1 Tax=Litoribrevibacter euphylliae TaxID=1834034 RepID=A0ABV7HIG5_9GAMM